jgi:predicted small integral membrane protein
MEKCVFFEVGTELLNMWMSFSFKGLKEVFPIYPAQMNKEI